MLFFFCLSFFVAVVATPLLIRYLRFFQPIRTFGPSSHSVKSKTPIFGGFAILVAILIPLVFSVNDWVLAVSLLFYPLGMFALGFLDDAVKLKKRNSGGISGKFRLAVEFILASVFVANLYYQGFSTNVFVPVPFWKVITLDMGLLFYPFVVLFMMSVTNAVNLTDGLDGLATTQVLLIILTCLLLHFVISPIVSSDFVLICVVCIGSLIGFLVHNSHPASIFMGEAGSLMLGGLVSVICVVLGVEFAFLLMGAFCFFETLSVVLQVSYFKLTKGKRIFRMSPLHHHFELGGIKESKIVVNAFIFTLICSTLTISTFLNGL